MGSCLLHSLASSSEDEYESLIVSEECGCVACRRMMNGVTSQGANERADSGSTNRTSWPPESLLSGSGLLSTWGSFCREAWMSGAVAHIIFIVLVRGSSGLREHSGFVCR